MSLLPKILLLLLFLCYLNSKAQQTIMYSQYEFNKSGLNPAASGTEIDQGVFYTFGISRQWIGFDNAPANNFMNVSYTIRPPRSYRYWQNVGIYFDSDRGGVFGNDNYYCNYSFHLLLRKTTVASFGVYAGVRSFLRSIGGAFDPSDPAVIRNRSIIYTFPDIVPGFRVSDKKYFMGVAVRQITISKMQDYKGRRIGSPSLLKPTIYFDYGRKMPLSDHILMMPSLALNIPIIGPPIIDYSVLFFFSNTVGAGIGLRNISLASAIAQFRFYKRVSVGIAYMYPVNDIRFASQNSIEIMVGIIPTGMNTNVRGRHSIAKCPPLTY